MNDFIYFYQHLPYYINPLALKIGIFQISWYSLMYLVGFLIVYLLLRWRVENDIAHEKFPISKFQNFILDFLIYAAFGVIIGGRLGYVIFYNFSYYLSHPLEIISPFSSAGELVGIYGMSYHGGLLGVLLATILFSRKYKINFWRWTDFVVPAVPAGYFFGRIGNFINGELYGRATNKIWGMYFPSDYAGLLRHPSQLYEAFLEGIVLFIILWLWRNKEKLKGQFLVVYIFGYSFFRFLAEFWRQPDEQLGFLAGRLTLGQILSLIFMVISILAYLAQKKKFSYNK